MSDTGSQSSNVPERLGDLPAADAARVSTSPADPDASNAPKMSEQERAEARRQRSLVRARARQARRESEALKSASIAVPLRTIDEPGTIQLLSNMPQPGRNRSWGAIFAFFLVVVAPTLLSGIYYYGYASDQYVSEFHFAVRNSTTTSQPSATSMLSSMLGISSPAESGENYLVADYLTSRQAAEELEAKIGIKALYGRVEADRWARFNTSLPMENFVTYWRHMVTANYDQMTGIATAQVRAFTPADAHLIATTLIKLAEDLVNEISERPRREAIAFAESEVKRAEDRLKKIRSELTQFRSAEGVIDPTTSVVTSHSLVAQTLRQTLSQLQTDLTTLTKQQLNPNAPQIVALQSRIKATREQLAVVESQVGKTSDSSKALSQVVGSYEQLDLERQFAQNVLVSAMQALEQARSTVMTQRIYVTPYVRPSFPESSTSPNRAASTLTVAGVAFLMWIVGFLVVRSMREHIV